MSIRSHSLFHVHERESRSFRDRGQMSHSRTEPWPTAAVTCVGSLFIFYHSDDVRRQSLCPCQVTHVCSSVVGLLSCLLSDVILFMYLSCDDWRAKIRLHSSIRLRFGFIPESGGDRVTFNNCSPVGFSFLWVRLDPNLGSLFPHIFPCFRQQFSLIVGCSGWVVHFCDCFVVSPPKCDRVGTKKSALVFVCLWGWASWVYFECSFKKGHLKREW